MPDLDLNMLCHAEEIIEMKVEYVIFLHGEEMCMFVIPEWFLSEFF